MGKVRVASNITLFNPLSLFKHVHLSVPSLPGKLFLPSTLPLYLSHPTQLLKDGTASVTCPKTLVYQTTLM